MNLGDAPAVGGGYPGWSERPRSLTIGSMATIQPTHTSAFYAQAALSFAVSFGAVLLGVVYLPGDSWMRAFLAVSLLYVVTSSFTLAKCVRDQQEQSKVVNRVDEVRLEKLLAEHDPFKSMT